MKPTHIATVKRDGAGYYLLEDGVPPIKYKRIMADGSVAGKWCASGMKQITDFDLDVWVIKKLNGFKGNK